MAVLFRLGLAVQEGVICEETGDGGDILWLVIGVELKQEGSKHASLWNTGGDWGWTGRVPFH